MSQKRQTSGEIRANGQRARPPTGPRCTSHPMPSKLVVRAAPNGESTPATTTAAPRGSIGDFFGGPVLMPLRRSRKALGAEASSSSSREAARVAMAARSALANASDCSSMLASRMSISVEI